jgi:hypothetical protein
VRRCIYALHPLHFDSPGGRARYSRVGHIPAAQRAINPVFIRAAMIRYFKAGDRVVTYTLGSKARSGTPACSLVPPGLPLPGEATVTGCTSLRAGDALNAYAKGAPRGGGGELTMLGEVTPDEPCAIEAPVGTMNDDWCTGPLVASAREVLKSLYIPRCLRGGDLWDSCCTMGNEQIRTSHSLCLYNRLKNNPPLPPPLPPRL